MPYKLKGNCVVKADTGENVKCHDSHEKALAHLRALEANVEDSLVTMSMRITKAAYNKSENTPMRWAAIDSDTDADLYQEKMSLELYQDFESRIKNNTPIPEEFKSLVCETDWCGGMPYLSIAHFKSGTEKKNVPGEVESIFIDGQKLKSKGVLYDTPLGRKVFDALRKDLYMEKSGKDDHLPVRISIGFLDLEHKHRQDGATPEYTFVREHPGSICPLCAQGIGGKIYTKGHLIHLALTRVPVNPRTQMVAERSMDEIKSKRDDAKSIVEELADGLEEKSIPSDILVVRSGAEWMDLCDKCYDPNTDSYDQACVDKVMNVYMPSERDKIGSDNPNKSVTSLNLSIEGKVTKKQLDAYNAVLKSIYKSQGWSLTEETMDKKPEEVKEKAMGIPEKKFEYMGISGDGNNTVPAPVKSKDGDEDDMEGEEKKEKSLLDQKFAALKSAMASGKASASDIQNMFNEVAQAVEKEYIPPAPTTSDIAEIVKSAVAQAIQPIAVELATLKATVSKGAINTVSTNERVPSRALNLRSVPEVDAQGMVNRAQNPAPVPTRKLSQIEEIAKRSTGAIR